VQAGSS